MDDLESLAAKAKEYVDYITMCFESWQKFGYPMPEGVGQAVEYLKKINEKLNIARKTVGIAN